MKLLLVLASTLLVQSAQVAPFIVPGGRGISGQVLITAGGEPAAGVSVAAFALPDGNTVIPPGEAKLAGVTYTNSFGNYLLFVPSAARPRHMIAVGTLNPGIADQLVARVYGFSSDKQTLDEVPRALFKVRGRLIRQDSMNNDVLRNTEVRLSARNSVTVAAKPGPQGSFEFTGIPPGTYSLRITPDALMDAVTVVVADRDVEGLEVAVSPKVRVAGTVALEGGVPLPTMKLTFWEGAARIPSQITVSLDRQFSLQLPPGPRRVSLSNLPRGYTVTTLTMQSSSSAGATDLLPLIATQESFPLNVGDSIRLAITLSASSSAGVKVGGRVTNPRGSRVEASTVRLSSLAIADNRDLTSVKEAAARGIILTNPDIAGNIETAVNADGAFEFPVVPPGTYDVSLPGNAWASANPPRRIVVASEDITNLTIEGPPLKAIPAQLVIEGMAGIPVDDAWPIWLSVGFGNVVGTRSAGDSLIAPNGAFTVRLPEREDPIRVTLGSAGYVIKAVEYGKTDALKNPVRLDSSPAELLRVTLTPVRTFVVPVILHRGQAARVGIPMMGPPGLAEPSGMTAPELLRGVAPEYSQARIDSIGNPTGAFYTGTGLLISPGGLWLDATIDKGGAVIPNLDLRSGLARLSPLDPLVQAIQKWEFKPAATKGTPTDAKVQIDVRVVVE